MKWLLYPLQLFDSSIQSKEIWRNNRRYPFFTISIKTPTSRNRCYCVRNAVMSLPQRSSSPSSSCDTISFTLALPLPITMPDTWLILHACLVNEFLKLYLIHKHNKKESHHSLLWCSSQTFGQEKASMTFFYVQGSKWINSENTEMSELFFVNKRNLKNLIWILIIS